MRTNKYNRQRGIALIAVLWVTAFLTIIASTVAYQSRSSLQMTKNRIDALKVRQAAEGAILVTAADLVNAPESLGNFRGGTYGRFEVDKINVEISLFDESGKIDLNTAPVQILRALLLEIGLDEKSSVRVANAIIDWRDEDDSVREGGAEDAQYYAAGLQYGSRDGFFRRKEELTLVYGVTPQIYAAISPHVTVYTQDFGVNLALASPLVQRAVSNASGLEESSINEEDDFFADAEEFSSLSGGYIYTIEARAKNSNGVTKRYSAIIRLDRGNTYEPFTILKWTQI